MEIIQSDNNTYAAIVGDLTLTYYKFLNAKNLNLVIGASI